ncbi:MAG: Gfo/Idh/MocA family oxidoreductase [Pirellulales bacterium]|nr:Gfo/Idh/MocA family oxidoreductase [Pirellulales bacterium]
MTAKIRTGLIRCDTHGLWYGPLMADHDPLVLQRPNRDVGNIERRYSWQSGGIHMFFYARYGYPTTMSVPFVGGFEIVKLWDADRDAAEQAKAIFHGRPQVCETPEECSDDVDLVLLADCNSDGSDHLQLAEPGLRKGVPTFVDKPFATTVADCRKLVELADKHKAPIFSASIVRFEPALEQFRNRLPEVGEVNFATVNGYGTHPAGLIHTISAVQLLFGAGIRTVQVMKTPKQISVWLDYQNNPRAPKHGTMIHTEMGERPYTSLAVDAYGSQNDIHTLVLGDFQYPWGTAEIIKIIQRMVQTRRTPPELNDMIEAVAVAEAFKQAEATGKAVQVESIGRIPV